MDDPNTALLQQQEIQPVVQEIDPAVSQPVTSPPSENEEQKKYRITKQFQDWVIYFTQKNHYLEIKNEETGVIEKRKTYGNRTISAIKAYSLDYDTQYFSAAQIGKENFQKHKNLSAKFADDLGLTYDFMMQVAKAKMGEKGTRMWELTMDELDYRKMTPDTVIQNNTQNNVIVNGEEAASFNDAFKKFLEKE